MKARIRIVGATSDRPTEDGARPVVFVVDDDVATVAMLRDVVGEAGWHARGFSRLADLCRAIEQRPPAMIILDDDLPDGRGGDLARDLREDPRLADVPLLVCTAAHPMRRAEIGKWAPVVSKPFDLSVIERFLGAVHTRSGRSSRGERAG